MGWFDFLGGKKQAPTGTDAPNAMAPPPPVPPASAPSDDAPAASGSVTPTPTRTGRRVVNKKAIDPENFNIISAQKTTTRDLFTTGDSHKARAERRQDREDETTTVYGEDNKKKCNLCCMMVGGAASFFLAMGMSVLHTAFFGYREQHRIRITPAKFCRHSAWTMIPTTMVATTMHYFLCDALWSNRRNTYGMAWVKAVGTNSLVWGLAIGSGTLFWRHGLRLTKFGSKLYYRYPTAPESLELRLVENPNALFTGMTWTYWGQGMILGQCGYLFVAGVVVMQNRVHLMMSPVGTYATACSPWWRREAIAASAGLTLRRSSERSEAE